MKKLLKYSFLTLLVLFLFRGWLFQILVTYHPVSELPTIASNNQDLSQSIENQQIDTTIQNIIHRSLLFTAHHLRFTFEKCDTDPNLLFASQKTNCIGYAAFFKMTCDGLLRKVKLENRFRVKQVRGKLTMLGFDLHRITKSPFFRDHDFNVVEDLQTGKKIFVDASTYDVWGIGYVSGD